MNTFLKSVLIFLAILAGIVLSFFSSVEAVKFAGGLRTDTWGMGSAYTMIFGAAAGLVVVLLAGIILACRKQTTFRAAFFTLLFIPPMTVSCLFAAPTYFGGTLPKNRYQAERQAISDAVREDPRALEALIAQARAGRLIDPGRSVLQDEARSSTRVKQEDMPFLVHYFMNDFHFVNVIMFDTTKVNESLFRNIYEHYKHKNTQDFPIIPRIALSEETPDDILEDIAEHNSRYPNTASYTKYETVRAKETLLWKRSKSDSSVIPQLITDIRAGKSGEAERRVILRLLATKRVTLEDVKDVDEQYLNDGDFIIVLMRDDNIGADFIRKVYDRYSEGESCNPSVAKSIISSVAEKQQTPSDVLQRIAMHKLDEDGGLYPRYVIERAKNTLLKMKPEPLRR